LSIKHSDIDPQLTAAAGTPEKKIKEKKKFVFEKMAKKFKRSRALEL